ncbi:hypothetical protein VB713_20550 [Anabaena cylindrica UHCC 0172]|nr:hypothetical protein [Anabaena cylindrica]MEA5553333.1 hypothetical protein [Anabaena cylindrica UHCC 0172]
MQKKTQPQEHTPPTGDSRDICKLGHDVNKCCKSCGQMPLTAK